MCTYIKNYIPMVYQTYDCFLGFFLQKQRRYNKLPFYSCTHIKHIWNQVQGYLLDCFHFFKLMPQTAISGLHNTDNETFLYSKSSTTFTQTT